MTKDINSKDLVVVHSADFEAAYSHDTPLPSTNLPELAFFGRSNVGKSSFINRLLQRKELARVSKSPGHTKSFNFFRCRTSAPKLGVKQCEFYAVDFPGFGYARYSLSQREAFNRSTVEYIAGREQLALAVLLLDSKREISDDEHSIIATAIRSGRNLAIVIAKCDRLNQSDRHRSIKALRDSLPEELAIFEAGLGMPNTKLWQHFFDRLAEPARAASIP